MAMPTRLRSHSRLRHRNQTRLPPHAKDQLLRASSSIGNNVSEGYGRISPKDKKIFYRIALESVRECGAIFAQEEITDATLLETKTVELLIANESLKFYDIKMKRVVEPGQFNAQVGGDSDQLIGQEFVVR
jgi:four helix bundle protein